MNYDYPKLLTPKECSEILGIKVQTMAVWRTTRRYHLPWVRSGRLIRYKIEDVKRFIEERTEKVIA